MDGLQAGQLSFLLRASSNTLPTPLNLKRWNFRVDAKCDLCLLLFFTFWMGVQLPLTSCDTLGGMMCAQEIWCICETPALYWRNAIYWPPMFESSGNPDSTIPFNLLVTTARPDMVNICNNTVVLIELTIPLNSPGSLNRAQSRKQTKQLYQ